MVEGGRREKGMVIMKSLDRAGISELNSDITMLNKISNSPDLNIFYGGFASLKHRTEKK